MDTIQVLKARVKAAAPYVNLQLPAEQERILVYMMGGLDLANAIKAAGANTSVEALSQDINFAAYYNYLAEKRRAEVNFTREDAHAMLLETHRKAINATEELNVIKELIALHGVQAPKTEVRINQNTNTHIHRNEVRTLPDEQLFELLDGDITDIEPELVDYDPPAIEGDKHARTG